MAVVRIGMGTRARLLFAVACLVVIFALAMKSALFEGALLHDVVAMRAAPID